MKNKALGFNKENILVVDLPTDDLQSKNEVLKTSLLELPEAQSATLCSDIPHRGIGANGYLPEGFDTRKIMWIVYGDADFMQTFDIQLIQGRHFDPSMATDKDAYIVNEKLIQSLGWDEPLGKRIQRNGIWHPIIGVVKDFHYSPMNQNIEPMIISSTPEYGGFFFLALKVASDNISNTVKEIEKKVADIAPSAPFEFWFLDDSFDSLYRFEERLNILFMCFAGLAILIAMLGLYSLVSISTEYKTKQIGIRKVLGSTVFGITRVVSKEFLWPVVLSNAIAWPITYVIAKSWLQTFAYKISLSWWLFLGAGLLTFVIALMTLSVQSIKAATANPVEALRYE
jgi:putative ABC transport system permease protein